MFRGIPLLFSSCLVVAFLQLAGRFLALTNSPAVATGDAVWVLQAASLFVKGKFQNNFCRAQNPICGCLTFMFIPSGKKKKQNILICIWYHAAFRDIAAPYLGSSADAPSPPLRDKNQNFDSSAPWAGARKFLAGSLCPTRGITPRSHQERPAKWSFPRLSACSSTIFGACFYPHVFLNWPWLLITQQLIPFNFDTHNVNYRLWVWVSVWVLKSFRHQKIATQQSLFKGTLKGQLCHLSRRKSKIQKSFSWLIDMQCGEWDSFH